MNTSVSARARFQTALGFIVIRSSQRSWTEMITSFINRTRNRFVGTRVCWGPMPTSGILYCKRLLRDAYRDCAWSDSSFSSSIRSTHAGAKTRRPLRMGLSDCVCVLTPEERTRRSSSRYFCTCNLSIVSHPLVPYSDANILQGHSVNIVVLL